MNDTDEGLHQPSKGGDGNHSINHILARLERAERKIDKRRAWFLTPSNLISLLAVAITVAIFVTTYGSGAKEALFRKQQQFSQLINQISALDSEVAQVYRSDILPLARVQALAAISHRRLALVNQAEALLTDVEHRASKSNLALLAPIYAGVGRFDKAEEYFRGVATDQSEQAVARIMAWRALVMLYGYMGPNRILITYQAHLALAGHRKLGFRRPRNQFSGRLAVDSRSPTSSRGRLRFVSAARMSLVRNQEAICHPVQQTRCDGARRELSPTPAERKEWHLLHPENRQVREERDILNGVRSYLVGDTWYDAATHPSASVFFSPNDFKRAAAKTVELPDGSSARYYLEVSPISEPRGQNGTSELPLQPPFDESACHGLSSTLVMVNNALTRPPNVGNSNG